MTANVEWVDEALSTNALITPDTPHGHCVAAVCQTAGRGQRGNSWEAEPGKNLTFSICLRPDRLPAQRQFEISASVAVAVCDFLRTLVDTPAWLTLKWPNDIYFGDRKLGGILIENSIQNGLIERSTIGIGINVNQIRFVSDAPNPISLIHITGLEMQLQPLLQQLADAIVQAGPCDMDCYRNHLWRNEGVYNFRDTATGTVFSASVAAIESDGRILLSGSDGSLHGYYFKEVEWIL